MHQVVVDHRSDLLDRGQLDRVELVTGAEPVEEVQERHPTGQRRNMGDDSHVRSLVHAGRAQHGEAGGARRHHIAVVAEDAERMRGQ